MKVAVDRRHRRGGPGDGPDPRGAGVPGRRLRAARVRAERRAARCPFAGRERRGPRALGRRGRAASTSRSSSAGASTSRAFLPAIGGARHGVHRQLQRVPDGPTRAAGRSPTVNPEALEGGRGRGSSRCPTARRSPRCSPWRPLHRAAGLRSLVLSSYQAVSGAGQKGTRELAEQIEKLRGQVEALARPDRDALPAGDVFGGRSRTTSSRRSATFEPDGFTGEEVKMMAEPRKILSAPDLAGGRHQRARPGAHRARGLDPRGLRAPDHVAEAREVLRERAGRRRCWTTPGPACSPRRWTRRGETTPTWAGSGRCPAATTRSRCSAARTTCGSARRSTP